MRLPARAQAEALEEAARQEAAWLAKENTNSATARAAATKDSDVRCQPPSTSPHTSLGAALEAFPAIFLTLNPPPGLAALAHYACPGGG